MSRLAWLFWAAAAADAALIAAVIFASPEAGRSDGGRAMGVFFFGLLPALVLALAAAAFVYGGRVVRPVATLVALLPALWLGALWLNDRSIDRRSADRASGAGYFRDETMRRMGVAVVQHDLAALRRLAPQVDLDAPGSDGMTLLALAVDSDFHPASARSDDLSVVRALLALGARPDAGLDAALKRPTPALLALLLQAGADPNQRSTDGQPIVFRWLAAMPPANLRLLAAHGLDLDSRSHDAPLAFVATIHQRWDLLSILIEAGADVRRPRADGRNVPDELRRQIDEIGAGKEPPADLRQALEWLNVRSASRFVHLRPGVSR